MPSHADSSGKPKNFEMLRKNSFTRLTGEMKRISNFAEDSNSPISASSRSKLTAMMNNFTPGDKNTIQKSLVRHIEYSLCKNRWNCDEEAMYRAAALSVRDRLVEGFNDTNAAFFKTDPKRVYYLSFEFLVGRAMQNALVNLDCESKYKEALKDVGFNLEHLYEHEHDAALGNGGLGRLAACFLDSSATLNLPVWGYGIRYTYGIFEQKIIKGRQVEHPDYWLTNSNCWEIERPDVNYKVRFGGEVQEYTNKNGCKAYSWTGGTVVQAEAYDNPLPGYDTTNCISLRLWRSRPTQEFDFSMFDSGDYLNAVAERQAADSISAVLYPNDNSDAGKELRFKQQYFFVCATIQDVLRRFKKMPNREWEDLPSKMVMQLNDTHPTIAIPELMRILIDIEELDYDRAWALCKEVFCYTTHTVLPEALEKWDASLIEKLLPRHILIINEINHRFIVDALKQDVSGSLIGQMSIYEEGDVKRIRMANMAVIGSKKVNGVAAMHSELVKEQVFPHFVEYYAKAEPGVEKFRNVTNGVTTRRWVHNANRKLSNLITDTLGDDAWLKNNNLCEGLAVKADDPAFQAKWVEVKQWCKKRLANWVKYHTGIQLDTNMMFDCQTKRIHEYKRQLMFAFWQVHNYLEIKAMSPEDRKTKVVPRACMVGGKAAPGYKRAKVIIKFLNNIANLVNNDPDVSPYFKCVFLPNYNVSSAAIIIPGTDLSEQISTAGLEASGTGNMKYVMNGAPIIGTMDGANVEIREEVGDDNIFIFGMLEHETHAAKKRAREGNYRPSENLQRVFDFVKDGKMSNGEQEAHVEFCDMIDSINNNGHGYCGDNYLVMADFDSYVECQKIASATYADQAKWNAMSIKGTAYMGKFSSDRSMCDYAEYIWECEPIDVASVGNKYEDIASFAISDKKENAPSQLKATAPVFLGGAPIPHPASVLTSAVPHKAEIATPVETRAPSASTN